MRSQQAQKAKDNKIEIVSNDMVRRLQNTKEELGAASMPVVGRQEGS